MPHVTNSVTNKTAPPSSGEYGNFLASVILFWNSFPMIKKKVSFIRDDRAREAFFVAPPRRGAVSPSVCGSGWECGTLSSPGRNSPCGALRGQRGVPVLGAHEGAGSWWRRGATRRPRGEFAGRPTHWAWRAGTGFQAHPGAGLGAGRAGPRGCWACSTGVQGAAPEPWPPGPQAQLSLILKIHSVAIYLLST